MVMKAEFALLFMGKAHVDLNDEFEISVDTDCSEMIDPLIWRDAEVVLEKPHTGPMDRMVTRCVRAQCRREQNRICGSSRHRLPVARGRHPSTGVCPRR